MISSPPSASRPRRRLLRRAVTRPWPLLAWAMLSLAPLPVPADWKADIGYTALQARLGSGIPKGTGIDVTHAEGLSGGGYKPDPAHVALAGKTFTLKSGPTGISSHATTVATFYYGSGSLAPLANPVDLFEAEDYLINFLKEESPFVPLYEARRVQNLSWAAYSGTTAVDVEWIRRLDLQIARDGVVVACAMNNGSGSAMLPFASSCYHSLAVGLTNGNSNRGPTLIDTAGRVKPDLVAPASVTSYASPMVASAAALLLEVADGISPPLSRPERALLVRGAILGGATKTEFAGWRKGFATPSTDGTVPLDYRYGSGELNVDLSHQILGAGRQTGGTGVLVGTVGWDLAAVPAGGERRYFFEIPPGSTGQRLSILATWYRRVVFHPPPDFDLDGDVDGDDADHLTACATGAELGPAGTGCTDADLDADGDVDLDDHARLQLCRGPCAADPAGGCQGYGDPQFTSSLSNVNLYLHDAVDFDLGAERDRSVSLIDNLEHIYQPTLPAGRYAIVLQSDQDEQVALTWWLQSSP